MTHPAQELWDGYAAGLLAEKDRERLDAHLSSCDECLTKYIDAVSQLTELPELMDADGLTERVMLQLPSEVPVAADRRGKLWSHPVLHYLVAAAVTLLLVSTGIFQAILDRTGQLPAGGASQAEIAWSEQESFSSRLLDRTVVMLDSIQSRTERGGKR